METQKPHHPTSAGGMRSCLRLNTPVFDLKVAFGPCCPFMCYYITHHSGIYIHPSMITSFYIHCGLEITAANISLVSRSRRQFCASTSELVSDSFQVVNPKTRTWSTVGFNCIWSVFAHFHQLLLKHTKKRPICPLWMTVETHHHRRLEYFQKQPDSFLICY